MLESISDHTKREGLDFGLGLGGSAAIRQDTGKLRHFRDPAPVILTFKLNLEPQAKPPTASLPQTAPQIHRHARLTLRISCERRTTLPWSAVTGPTMVLRPASTRPSSAASACSTPPCASPRRCCRPFLRLGQIVRPIHSKALANATREGVARRVLLSLPSRQGCDAPKHGGRPPAALGRHGTALRARAQQRSAAGPSL